MLEERLFQRLQRLIYDESGIALSSEKLQLVENRLQRRMRKLGMGDAAKYLEIVEADVTGAELRELLNAISTNVTYFWREERHFDVLAHHLRAVAQRRSGEIKLWCAASSTGEEPYTMAMIAAQSLDLQRNPCRILATDISTDALSRAVQGVYRREQVVRLPDELVECYFQEGADETVAVSPEIRAMVTFRRLNLVKTPYPLRGPFDAIFCRNVMIYFDATGRGSVVREVERLLAPGGLFVISHSENLLGIQHSLKLQSSAVYARGER